MGMFDTVYVKCPGCGERVGCQSKSGGCYLDEYELDTAPIEVLAGILGGNGWTYCETCDRDIVIKAPTGWSVKLGDDDSSRK